MGYVTHEFTHTTSFKYFNVLDDELDTTPTHRNKNTLQKAHLHQGAAEDELVSCSLVDLPFLHKSEVANLFTKLGRFHGYLDQLTKIRESGALVHKKL